MNILTTPQLGQITDNTPIVLSIIEPNQKNGPDLNKGLIVIGAIILAIMVMAGSKKV